MPWALPLTALITAAGLEWAKWGRGAWNWGPRVGALFLLVFGDVAFRGTFAGDWLRRGIDYLAGWVNVAVTYVLGSGAGAAAAGLIHWLPAALVGAYWVAAWIPGSWFGERMTWRLAWIGVLLPTFLSTVPGLAGGLLTTIFHFAVSVGAAIIGVLFAVGGAVHL